MNEEKRYFIELLSSFVNETVPKGKSVDFMGLYRLADIHDVGGIIANQLKLVDNGFIPDGEVKSYFNQSLGYTVKNYALRENAYEMTKEFLVSCKCKHVFVKGINIMRYYPQPELRTSGDIDVIVEENSLETLYKEAKSRGLIIKEYVSHTLTLMFFNTEIEIHSQPDVLSNYFDGLFDIADKKSEYEYRLNEYDELLFVICHLAKHLAYRGAGIRMLLDVDLIIRGIESFDSARFFRLCKEAEILKTAEIITSLCKLWFGTPVESTLEIDPDLLNKLEDVFLDGGSFGYEMSTVPAKYVGGSRLKVILKMAFPDKEYLKICYPYYKKHAFLYPIARLNRLFDGIFKKKNRAMNALKFSSSDSRLQLEVLKELEINKE